MSSEATSSIAPTVHADTIDYDVVFRASRYEEGEGDYLLLENHCPVCSAARACQGLCASELELFQRVLGPGVTVVREDHILAGARRCATPGL